MIETDHQFVVEAPLGDVWSYVSDISNWASSMPGYQSFEETDDRHSTWVLKVALGALTRTMRLNVTIDDRREPEFISFSLEGANDPVGGRGSFAATPAGPRQTSVVVTLAIAGSGPMAGTMEAMSRPVVPRMTRAVSASLKQAIEGSAPAPAQRRRWWTRWRAWLRRR
jgi:carbon monoxide dehydrogenase subunit G